MKPAPFTYHAPSSVSEAVKLLADLPNAKVLAGGQSLVPVLNMRLAAPEHLVDINRIADLAQTQVGKDAVTVGALVRHADLERDEAANAALPLLRQALQWVAHPAIRNRGTTVGSIVHADPSGEMPAILALTGGSVHAVSSRGERDISAEEFFVGAMESSLELDELVTSATFPLFEPGTVTGYDELARRSGDYALAGVAMALTCTDGVVSRVKASFVSVTDVPNVLDLTDLVQGREPAQISGDDLAKVADAVREHVDPVDDIHASGEYRAHLSGTISRRVLGRLLASTNQPEPATTGSRQ